MEEAQASDEMTSSCDNSIPYFQQSWTPDTERCQQLKQCNLFLVA
jgi:hypothetical protein